MRLRKHGLDLKAQRSAPNVCVWIDGLNLGTRTAPYRNARAGVQLGWYLEAEHMESCRYRVLSLETPSVGKKKAAVDPRFMVWKQFRSVQDGSA